MLAFPSFLPPFGSDISWHLGVLGLWLYFLSSITLGFAIYIILFHPHIILSQFSCNIDQRIRSVASVSTQTDYISSSLIGGSEQTIHNSPWLDSFDHIKERLQRISQDWVHFEPYALECLKEVECPPKRATSDILARKSVARLVIRFFANSLRELCDAYKSRSSCNRLPTLPFKCELLASAVRSNEHLRSLFTDSFVCVHPRCSHNFMPTSGSSSEN